MKNATEKSISKKIILFGAGLNGKKALEKYGKEKVAYFCDNNINLINTYIDGVLVISYSKLVSLLKTYPDKYSVIVTPVNNWTICRQLEKSGVITYHRFISDDMAYGIKNLNNLSLKDIESNNRLDGYIKKSESIDPLEDIEGFTKIVDEARLEYREGRLDLLRKGKIREGDFYGNCYDLIKYAGLSMEDYLDYIPLVSHIDCCPTMYKVSDVFYSTITSGIDLKRHVHNVAPYIPVYTVGPYIQYASGMYDDTYIKRKKKENGRTLLVYLPHSTENGNKNFGKEQFIDNVILQYGKEFDTIMLCVYFVDLSRELVVYAKERGLKVVSNGFRFDYHFNSRQKSLIELSDAVVCGDWGTFVGYALYMNKPMARVDIDLKNITYYSAYEKEWQKDYSTSEEYIKYESDFKRYFSDELQINTEMKTWIDPYMGLTIKRSKQYIRTIFEICKDIWLQCNGNIMKYPSAVCEVTEKYINDSDFFKADILQEALKDNG